jgi:hypothetical protein
MATISIEIKEARRELAKFQKLAKFYTSQHRQFRAQKSNLAQQYKLMAKYGLARVRSLKRYIKESEDLQKRIDELDRRIAKLSSG